MLTIMESHHHAMDLADQADKVRRAGKLEEAHGLLLQALEFEKAAACKLADTFEIEPTRSVLYRSSASLALECNELREAERLIAMGLSGNPPDKIMEELRDLLEQVHFERHLSLRGVVLSPDEFQLSMWGGRVGPGIIPTKEITDRISEIEALATRTLERRMNMPFRQGMRPPKEVRERLEFFVSSARAASYSMTIRIGAPQSEFEGMGGAEEVVTEIMDCLDLAVGEKTTELRERIADADYFENFVRLTRMLSPDGQRVEHVGLTAIRRAAERRVVLRKKTELIKAQAQPATEDQQDVVGVLTLTGNLRFADSTRKREGLIEIVESSGVVHKVAAPLAMMADIVRPLYEYDVVAKVRRRRGRTFTLEDIDRIDE
jgi:hypothetical protein